MNTKEIPDEIKTEIIVDWILKEIGDSIVPADEGNADALVYNMVHLARYGWGNFKLYNYEPEQDEEIKSWNLQ